METITSLESRKLYLRQKLDTLKLDHKPKEKLRILRQLQKVVDKLEAIKLEFKAIWEAMLYDANKPLREVEKLDVSRQCRKDFKIPHRRKGFKLEPKPSPTGVPRIKIIPPKGR